MSGLFTDGAPLDADSLSKLETDLKNLNAKTAEIGLTNSTVKKKILSGTTESKKFTSGNKPEPIEIVFPDTFTIPPVVVATLYNKTGNLADDEINLAIGEVTTSRAIIYVYFKSTNKTKEKSIRINWIAITS